MEQKTLSASQGDLSILQNPRAHYHKNYNSLSCDYMNITSFWV